MSEITKHDAPLGNESDLKLRMSRAFLATSARLGLVAGAAVSDILGQLRQEAPHFAAEFRPELRMAVLGLIGLGAAVVGALMLVLAMNVAAASMLTATMSWSAALSCLAGFWIFVGLSGVLIAKRQLGQLIGPKPQA
jgi:hypothetical protein